MNLRKKRNENSLREYGIWYEELPKKKTDRDSSIDPAFIDLLDNRPSVIRMFFVRAYKRILAGVRKIFVKVRSLR